MCEFVSKEQVISTLKNDLSEIMDNWAKNYSNNCSGGKMRGDRGEDIEKFVRKSVDFIGRQLGANLVAKRGNDDKKLCKITLDSGKEIGKEIRKFHQVDVHIYLNDVFVCVIECKAYLDSCYYVRACDDFKLFQKFGYLVKHTIFTLENSIDEDTKIFTDHLTDYICNDVFYILDGKRSSAKPIYDEKYKKIINHDNFVRFIEFIYSIAQG
jgi:hypothetical protein